MSKSAPNMNICFIVFLNIWLEIEKKETKTKKKKKKNK